METFIPDLDSPGDLLRYGPVLRCALTIRMTEQRLLELFSEGKLFGTVHTCIGQELVGPAVVPGLRENDTVFSNHRCHGHFIAYCDQVEALIAEIMGKSTGVCAGLGGSQHLHFKRFFSNGIQGGIAPVAAGLALAHKLEGAGDISVVFIGDGTLGQGVVYETLNLISKWDLPLLLVLENNLYAQSTHQGQTLAGGIAERFAAFGIETACSSTWQWQQLLDEMRASVERVRTTGRPRFHQVDTYRLMAHSKGDDNRPSEVVEPFSQRDPLNLVLQRYQGHSWLRQILGQIHERIDKAVALAETAPFSCFPTATPESAEPVWKPVQFNKERVVAGIRGSLAEALERDPKVVIIGEDVESPYGGAFKVTTGLSENFPDRVRNTPISEAAITGIGNGLALGGYRPVVEIMFGDFLTLATDQWVNHAAKFAWMYNGQVKVPLILRTPMGGKRGYGPTHSQSIERLFVGQQGTRVLMLHHRYSPALLYRNLFAAGDAPTLVVENKLLYGAMADPVPLPGFQLLEGGGPFPVVRLKPDGAADITLVTLGGVSQDAEQALRILFEEHEVLADLFLPTQVYPMDISAFCESLAETHRLLVVEEGHGFASVGSEILAQVAERPGLGKIVCARVYSAHTSIPSARPLEAQCLPDAAAIVAKALEVLRG